MRKILYNIIGVGCWLLSSCTTTVENAKQESILPQIYPDYIGVTIPVNIAPLCFNMADETAMLVDAIITDSHGNALHSQGKESVDFDLDDWHQLLGQNRGDSLSVTVSAKYDDGWHTYQPFSIYVSPDGIDYGICYRLIEPGYEVWSKMGIYERDLSSFDERALIENTQFEGCVNCHSFNRGNSADMSLHIRGPHGATLLRQNNGPFTAYNTKTDQTLGFCVYPYWHPSGRMSCCSLRFSSRTPSMRPFPFSPLTDVRSISVRLNPFLRAVISSILSAIISVVLISIRRQVASVIV